MRNHWAILVLVAVALLVVPAPAALAQDNCQAFKALGQATVVVDPTTMPPVLTNDPLAPQFVWGGLAFAAIGSPGTSGAMEGLTGWFYGTDAATSPIYGKANGRGKDGYYLFTFGTHDANGWLTPDGFKLQLGQAVWTPNPAGMFTVGSYQASGTLVEGYGRFEGASGSFTLHGEFLFYPIAAFPGFVSAWNPTLEGKVCK